MGAIKDAGTESGGREAEARTGKCDANRDGGSGRQAELSDCLSRRGGPGQRAGVFLESAHWLLAVDAPGLVCRGEAVAYCVREAADSILKSAGTVPSDSGWRELSQRVVDAKDRYDQAVRFSELGDFETSPALEAGGSEAALADLLKEIDALADFKQNSPTQNKMRAAEVNARLTGSPAQQGDLAPMTEFLRAHERASDFLHSRCSVEEAERLLWECEGAMLGLLRSPADREGELADVAGRDGPGDADLEDAQRLISTDRDLEVFLDRIVDPAWLALLNRDGRLNPPSGEDGRWVAHRAAVRLSASHRQQVTDWLVSVAEQRLGDGGWCTAVVGALLNMENPDIALALRFAERHYASGHMLWFFGRALEDADPSDAVVCRCADVFLNSLAATEDRAGQGMASAWDQMPWDLMGLLRMVADGADEANAADRIEMLLRKLRRMPQRNGDLDIYPFDRDRQLPISALLECDLDETAAYDEDPIHALGGCVVSILGKAMGWLPAAQLLDLAVIAPQGLAGRLRTWVLAAALDADSDAMAAEIERTIGSRRPNGDDIALIDRLTRCADPHVYWDRWRAALGDPPTEAEARQAIESPELLPDRLWYSYLWSPLLPEAVSEEWTGAPGLQALAEEIGPPEGRDHYIGLLENPDSGGVWSGPVPPPLSADDLRSLEPERAAAQIAAWRPQPLDWPHSYRLIARELEELVQDDPAGWLTDPLMIAGTLHHPTYIATYLRAAARAAADNPDCFDAAIVGGLVDVMAAVQAEPWPAAPLEGDSRPYVDYDPDWVPARRAGTTLARALLRSGVGLAGRDDDVWDYLEGEARSNPHFFEASLPEPSFADDPIGHMLENAGKRNTAADPRFLAINQANTEAVDAALSFIAAEHTTTEDVRPGAVELIEWCLSQPGLEGAKHRAIIAPAAGFLRRVLPDWYDENHSILFGGDAPDRLGQLSVDLAVKVSQPWDWLLLNYRDSIHDSAARGSDRSLLWLMAAMLSRIDGYKPRRLAQRLGDDLPQACGVLAGLIDHADKTPEQMEAFSTFCDAVVEYRRGEHAAALGRLAYASSLDHGTWATITLKALDKTGGLIGQSHAIVKRILENPPTPQGAAILAWLVEVQTNSARTQTEDHQDSHRNGTYPRRLIADGVGDWLDTVQSSEPGDEYSRLKEKLKDHALFRPTNSPEGR